MKLRQACAVALAIATISSTVAHASRPKEPRTEAGVLAADDDWLAAERRGDVPALDRRLSGAYRDVEPDGKVHRKAELLAITARRSPRSIGSVAEVAAEFRKQQPVTQEVVIVGDTAILSFHSTEPSTKSLVSSVDVFAYEGGMWKGLLSKHSSKPSPAS